MTDDWVTMLMVAPDGSLRRLTKGGVASFEAPFYADGSGGEYAMGAMAMGANARQAVQVACRFDLASGDGIDTLTLRTKGTGRGRHRRR